MGLPILVKKSDSEKIQRTIDRLADDIGKAEAAIAAEDRIIEQASYDVYSGDLKREKVLSKARGRRERQAVRLQEFRAAQSIAVQRLSEAKADEEAAKLAEDRIKLEKLLAARMKSVQQIEELIAALRDSIQAMHADVPEINALRSSIMKEHGKDALIGWATIIEPPQAQFRLAEAAHSMGLAEVFNTGSGGNSPNSRSITEVEQEVCDTILWQIRYSDQIDRKAHGEEVGDIELSPYTARKRRERKKAAA